LRQAERRAAISRVASVIAHLIGTPLHVIAGRAALIRSNPTPENAIENARRIEEQVERLAQRIRRLIQHLTSPRPAREPRQVSALVSDALAMYAPIAARRGLEISAAAAPPDAMVDGNAALIVLTSLLSLGSRTAAPGSRIELRFQLMPDQRLAFELSIPGLAVPKSGIDRLDPPEDVEVDSELLQVLSVCNAIARQNGDRLELVAPLGTMAIRYECQTMA
jgi:signal transduction histidine kinase